MKIAKAVHGFKRVIVPVCPYCHGEHQHAENAQGVRMADCLQGEYQLDSNAVDDDQSAKSYPQISRKPVDKSVDNLVDSLWITQELSTEGGMK